MVERICLNWRHIAHAFIPRYPYEFSCKVWRQNIAVDLLHRDWGCPFYNKPLPFVKLYLLFMKVKID